MKQSLINEYERLRHEIFSLSASQWAFGVDYPLQLRRDRIYRILAIRYGYEG